MIFIYYNYQFSRPKLKHPKNFLTLSVPVPMGCYVWHGGRGTRTFCHPKISRAWRNPVTQNWPSRGENIPQMGTFLLLSFSSKPPLRGVNGHNKLSSGS